MRIFWLIVAVIATVVAIVGYYMLFSEFSFLRLVVAWTTTMLVVGLWVVAKAAWNKDI